jgi:TRAP-type mannitol/chloroaromatic compound transport system substrate-binding protein
VHQPGSQCAVFFNKDAYNKLPEDLKYIIDICAKETQLWSINWINALNAKAINEFAKKVEIVQMDKDTLIQFRKTTHDYVEDLKAKYPDVKKVVDSQQEFVKSFAPWREARGNVAPWPYEEYIKGNTAQ